VHGVAVTFFILGADFNGDGHAVAWPSPRG
jgi:hypothetical protein